MCVKANEEDDDGEEEKKLKGNENRKIQCQGDVIALRFLLDFVRLMENEVDSANELISQEKACL